MQGAAFNGSGKQGPHFTARRSGERNARPGQDDEICNARGSRAAHAAPMLLLFILLALAAPAHAQLGPAGPAAVGVVTVHKQPVTEVSEFVGRIQAIDKVDLVARVTAFIQRTAVRRRRRSAARATCCTGWSARPFEADLQAKQAGVGADAGPAAQRDHHPGTRPATAQHPGRATLDGRRRPGPAGQLRGPGATGPEAQVQSSQVNLDYTEIRAPVSGKITRTALTVGNVVTPSSGPLATIVSQDPMYVLFPVPVRTALDLRNRYANRRRLRGRHHPPGSCRTAGPTTRSAGSTMSIPQSPRRPTR